MGLYILWKLMRCWCKVKHLQWMLPCTRALLTHPDRKIFGKPFLPYVPVHLLFKETELDCTLGYVSWCWYSHRLCCPHCSEFSFFKKGLIHLLHTNENPYCLGFPFLWCMQLGFFFTETQFKTTRELANGCDDASEWACSCTSSRWAITFHPIISLSTSVQGDGLCNHKDPCIPLSYFHR